MQRADNEDARIDDTGAEAEDVLTDDAAPSDPKAVHFKKLSESK